MKDEALSNDQVKIAELPIAVRALNHADVPRLAMQLSTLAVQVSAAQHQTIDWLLHEFQLVKPGRALAEATSLDADHFVSAVREAWRQKLTHSRFGEMICRLFFTIPPSRENGVATTLLMNSDTSFCIGG